MDDDKELQAVTPKAIDTETTWEARLQEALQQAELEYLVERMREPVEQWLRGDRGKEVNLEELFERVDKRRAETTDVE